MAQGNFVPPMATILWATRGTCTGLGKDSWHLETGKQCGPVPPASHLARIDKNQADWYAWICTVLSCTEWVFWLRFQIHSSLLNLFVVWCKYSLGRMLVLHVCSIHQEGISPPRGLPTSLVSKFFFKENLLQAHWLGCGFASKCCFELSQ